MDGLLLVASLVALRWRRAPLAWVACLVAADPLWAQAFSALVGPRVPPEILVQVLATVAGDAPLWAAFVVGFSALAPRSGERGSV